MHGSPPQCIGYDLQDGEPVTFLKCSIEYLTYGLSSMYYLQAGAPVSMQITRSLLSLEMNFQRFPLIEYLRKGISQISLVFVHPAFLCAKKYQNTSETL